VAELLEAFEADGGIRLSIAVHITRDQLNKWSPMHITDFFHGLATVIQAQFVADTQAELTANIDSIRKSLTQINADYEELKRRVETESTPPAGA